MPTTAKAFQSDANPLILDPVLPRSQTIIEEQCFTWKTCSLYVSSSTCTRDGSLVGETMKKTTGENLKLS